MKSETLVLGVISSLLASVLLIGVRFLAGEQISSSELLILVVVAALTFLVLMTFTPRLFRALRTSHEVATRAKFLTEFSTDMERKTGLVQIFTNFAAAKPEIIDQIRKSKRQYYFLQMGKTIMSGNDMIGENLTERPIPDDHDIRILHASLRNPYLSESAARSRKINYQKWQNEFKYFRDKAPLFQMRNIKVRQHMEGFIWRFFVFDDYCFVQPYFHTQGNDERAPVYKLARRRSAQSGEGASGSGNEVSLYRSFESLFALKWEENAPPSVSLRRLVERQELISVTAVLRLNDLFVFVVPNRFVADGNGEIRFHGVGGKIASSEQIVDALRREAREELACSVEIEDSHTTLSASAGTDRELVEVLEHPRPIYIYKRPNRSDRILEEGHSFIVAFAARLSETTEIKPSNEIHSVLVLSRDILSRAMRGEITYSDIENSTDGSRIISNRKEDLLTRRAAPSGLAEFIIEIGLA